MIEKYDSNGNKIMSGGQVKVAPRSGTFPAGQTTYTINDADITATSRVDVYDDGTAIGSWVVDSYDGYIVITSNATETSNVPLEYFIRS